MSLELQTGVVCPLFNKGDQKVCFHFIGITLLSLHGKVYARVLEGRVYPLVKPWIQQEQCGFHPGCVAMGQHFTFTIIPEGA